MNRTVALVILFAVAPLLMGHGAGLGSIPIPANYVSSGEQFLTVVTIDTHEPVDSPTAKLGFISLQDRPGQGARTAQAVFYVPADFPFFVGCETNLTQTRFVIQDSGNPGSRVALQIWIDADLVATLFDRLGTTVNKTSRIPAITHVLNGSGNGVCMNQGAAGTGQLFMDAVVEILVPPK